MGDFGADVSKWVRKAKAVGELAFANIAQAAAYRIKELTPVKTGFLRANWIVTTDISHLNGQQPLEADIVSARLGETIYIVNPVVYARRVEYGFVGTDSLGRHYNQMGHHMVQQTMKELPEIAKQVIADLRR